MGLSAAQARYLFISNRTKDLENNLMRISNRQLTLADRADEIAALQNKAQNTNTLYFNDDANFSYADLMGDTALYNNQLYLVTTNKGSDSKVVLDTRYKNGISNTPISKDGGVSTNAYYALFLEGMGLQPSNEKGYTIEMLINNSPVYVQEPTLNTELKDKINLFINTYGGPKMVSTRPNYVSGAVESIIERDKMNKGSVYQYVVQDSPSTQTQGYTFDYPYAAKLESFYDGAPVANYSTTGNISNKFGQIKHYIKQNYFNNSNLTPEQQAENLINVLKNETNRNNLITQMKSTLGVFTGNGFPSGIEDPEYAFLKAFGGYLNDSSFMNVLSNGGNCDYRMTVYYLFSGTSLPGDTFPVNEKQLTYAEWCNLVERNADEDVKTALNRWKSCGYADNYLDTICTVTSSVPKYPNDSTDTAVESDLVMVARYRAVFDNICQKGWVYDENAYDSKTFSNNLKNIVYLVNSVTASNLSEFTIRSVSSIENIEMYYKNELNNIKNEEKKLEVKSVALQTELNALSTEEASVKAIIDGNVERTFSIFG